MHSINTDMDPAGYALIRPYGMSDWLFWKGEKGILPPDCQRITFETVSAYCDEAVRKIGDIYPSSGEASLLWIIQYLYGSRPYSEEEISRLIGDYDPAKARELQLLRTEFAGTQPGFPEPEPSVPDRFYPDSITNAIEAFNQDPAAGLSYGMFPIGAVPLYLVDEANYVVEDENVLVIGLSVSLSDAAGLFRGRLAPLAELIGETIPVHARQTEAMGNWLTEFFAHFQQLGLPVRLVGAESAGSALPMEMNELNLYPNKKLTRLPLWLLFDKR